MIYFSPESMNETLQVIRKGKGRVTLIAGGTNVIQDVRAKVLKPALLVDLSHLKGLSYIKEDKRRIRIGGLTTIAELASSKVIQKCAPILSDAAGQLGNPLVRNRATIAGNLADASPAADIAVPLLTLEATLVTDKRPIPIDQFFVGPNQTILRRGEIIKEIFFSKPVPSSKMGYFKLGLRNAMAISVVSMAVLVEMEGAKCKKARVGLGAVAPTPIRACRTEEMLVGKVITSELIEACGHQAAKEVQPINDIRASAEYRRAMTSVLLGRLIQQITLFRK